MYYHEVGETSNSYTRMIFQNEMLSGQDQDYLADLMVREKEAAMAFDPSGFYICLTGLPKRISTGRYGRSANDNMVYYIRLEREMRQLFERLGCSGEVILHLYEDKQIVLLFSFADASSEEQHACALRIAQSACTLLQRMYEQSYLKDGAYANVTLLSRRLTAWNQIGPEMCRMTRRWNRCFFRMEAAVWLPDVWNSQPVHPANTELGEARHFLQQAVVAGDDARAAPCLRRIMIDMIKPSFDEYLLRDTLAWLKSRFNQFCGTYGGMEMTDREIDRLFDAALYPNIEMLTDKLENAFCQLARFAAAQDRRYSLLTQRALRLLREQATERDMSLTYVAERLDVSSAYLSSVFKREAGVSLTQYITQVRIAQAKKLLQETGLTVEQIAQRVGFEGKRYFGTVFKRETGITPQAYRISTRE